MMKPETVESDADRRRRLKAHYVECDRIDALNRAIRREHERQVRRWKAWEPVPMPFLSLLRCPPHPDDLRGMACGAKTRAGTPCKLTAIFRNGRCKLHGGMSTGPSTDAGRKRSALNGNARKTKRTP